MKNYQIISNFIAQYNSGIHTVFNMYNKDNQMSFETFINHISNKLDYDLSNIDVNRLSDDELNSTLFYSVGDTAKKVFRPIVKEQKKYLCPGCLFINKKTILFGSKYLKCSQCTNQGKQTLDLKWIRFYKSFECHNISGFKCKDCLRFIPSNLSKDNNIICPYLDCIFEGKTSDLKKMHHPSDQQEEPKVCLEPVIDSNSNSDTNETINISNIKSIIEYESNHLAYTSCNFTVKHKMLVYQAFSNLLQQFPKEMNDYLINNSRSGGFQHKIFQEYISLLESSLPFVVRKNKKVIRIDNLLHESLCLFDGISTFNATVINDIIKNNTQEYYIGNRKASYSKPYYIGKLLNIIDLTNNRSILNNVTEYSFSKIKLSDIDNSTPVVVTHLRIPPHYQMGGMVYVNRIRKQIVDSLKENSNTERLS